MVQPASQPETASLRIPNARPEIDRVEEQVLAALRRFNYPEESLFAVRLSLEEAIVNAFFHGHRHLPPETMVDVQYRVGPDALEVAVTDQGPGFDPADVPDPTLDDNLEKPSGRGLMLIRSFMTNVRHENNGRRLIMRYERPAAN